MKKTIPSLSIITLFWNIMFRETKIERYDSRFLIRTVWEDNRAVFLNLVFVINFTQKTFKFFSPNYSCLLKSQYHRYIVCLLNIYRFTFRCLFNTHIYWDTVCTVALWGGIQTIVIWFLPLHLKKQFSHP